MILISILGPTSSGKSELAVDLATYLNHKFGDNSSVIISADSRQIYKGLNLGTGKVEGKWVGDDFFGPVYKYKNISHFLIDFLKPNTNYSLNQYIEDFKNIFTRSEIQDKVKYVILCGGTGLFAKAIYEEYNLESLNPKFENEYEFLRLELNKRNAIELQQELIALNIKELNSLNQSDRSNPRRLINLLLKFKAKSNNWLSSSKTTFPRFEVKFQFYLEPDNLMEKVATRLHYRDASGLIEETTNLINKGDLNLVSLLQLGLEYRQFYYYYLGIQTKTEFINNCLKENLDYVKRQMVWFKKQKGLIKVSNLEDIINNCNLN